MTSIQRQLLAILVRDFGYDHEPTYGHAPLRHQFGWREAVEGVAAVDVDRTVTEMRAAAAAEGEVIPDPYARATDLDT